MLAVIAVVLSTGHVETPAKPDLERLQGTWVLVSAESEGKEVRIQMTRQIVRDEFTDVVNGRAGTPLKLRLDETQTPRTWDVTTRNGEIRSAIYKLEGDTWTMCYPMKPNSVRPTRFSAKPGEKTMLSVFKRMAK